MTHLKKQVEFGSRPSGSPELEKTRAYLIQILKAEGLDVQEQSFTNQTPRGTVRFVNLIARLPKNGLPASLSSRLIIASHYDTKYLPEIPFVGANDSASSTAVLLEIASTIAKSKFHPKNIQLEFVFFDGEEAFEKYSPTDGLYGSRYYIAQQEKLGILREIKGMVLLDMVGDRDLMIGIPAGDPGLTRQIFEASKKVGHRDFFELQAREILDDHSPFVNLGIPAVDLIDFDYGPGNAWWHTAEDGLDKISETSLKITGETVLKFLEDYQPETPKK